ncbi:MAG: hypothetical protein ACLQJR_21515 [Stellaceae bacterium]
MLDALKTRLMDPSLFEVFTDEFYRELNRIRGAEHAKRQQLQDELGTIDRRLRKLVDAIAEGVPVRTLKDELLRLETRQEEVQTLMSKPIEDRPLIHPALAAVYRRKVADLHSALEKEDMRAEGSRSCASSSRRSRSRRRTATCASILRVRSPASCGWRPAARCPSRSTTGSSK